MTPNTEPQEYKDTDRCFPFIFRLHAWASLFGVPYPFVYKYPQILHHYAIEISPRSFLAGFRVRGLGCDDRVIPC